MLLVSLISNSYDKNNENVDNVLHSWTTLEKEEDWNTAIVSGNIIVQYASYKENCIHVADTMKVSDLPVLAASRILTKSSDFPCL